MDYNVYENVSLIMGRSSSFGQVILLRVWPVGGQGFAQVKHIWENEKLEKKK